LKRFIPEKFEDERGPVMVIYPDNTWYGGVETEKESEKAVII